MGPGLNRIYVTLLYHLWTTGESGQRLHAYLKLPTSFAGKLQANSRRAADYWFDSIVFTLAEACKREVRGTAPILLATPGHRRWSLGKARQTLIHDEFAGNPYIPTWPFYSAPIQGTALPREEVAGPDESIFIQYSALEIKGCPDALRASKS